jgi:hypothetical protein
MGAWLAVVGALLGSLAGCSDSALSSTNGVSVEDSSSSSSSLTTQYRDSAGRFEIRFPFEPKQSEKEDRGASLVLKLVTIEASTDQQIFSMAYSDAPAGVALTRTQVLAESVARENADRDKGELVNVRTTTLFGRPALEFEVAATNGSSRYFDINVVLGGRRYELTVTQRGKDRSDFDEFVRSFHLLEPPLAAGANFFTAAEKLCASFASSRPARPANETSTQHADAIKAVVDYDESLVKTLSSTPANPDEQGDAAAFIDSLRRSIPHGRAYVDAIRTNDPKTEELGRAATPDMELASKIANSHQAPSCP